MRRALRSPPPPPVLGLNAGPADLAGPGPGGGGAGGPGGGGGGGMAPGVVNHSLINMSGAAVHLLPSQLTARWTQLLQPSLSSVADHRYLGQVTVVL